MIRRVVVAVEDRAEGVSADGCALDCAGEISHRSGAEVTMLRVDPAPAVRAELESLTPYRLEGMVEQDVASGSADTATGRAAFGTLKARVEGAWGVEVDPATARAASGAWVGAERRLERLEGDLLVARFGRGPCPHGNLAEVTEPMLRGLVLPVLLVPSGTCPFLRTLDHVLVALDGSLEAERALPVVADLLAGREATLHLLTVVQPFSPWGALRHRGPATLSRAGAETYLAEVAGVLERTGRAVETHVLEAMDPAESILAEAGRLRTDLLALAIAPHAGLRRLLPRRVVPTVLEQLDRPLLLVPPAGPEAGAGGSGTRAH